MERLVIFGNRSMAVNAYYELVHDASYELSAFTVDGEYITEDRLLGVPVLPFDEVASVCSPSQHKMFIAVGYVGTNHVRAERYLQAKQMGYELVSHINSRATTWPDLEMGDNCQITAGSVVFPTVQIGNDVFIGACCAIAHDTAIGDHCFLSDGVTIAGGVTVGSYCFLGSHATIRNRITVARECVIGAGAVVLEDTEAKGVYIAAAAERLPIRSDQLPLT